MDVTVVGAGILGSLTAFRLAKMGHVVTLIDSSDDLSTGASGNSFAWLNAFTKTPDHYHNLNFRSMQYWSLLGSELGFDNIGLRFGGKLQWENDKGKADLLNQRIKKLQSLGYRARNISLEEIESMEPGINLGNPLTAVISEIEGTVEPNLVVRECINRIRDLGGNIILGDAVTDFRTHGSSSGRRITHVDTSAQSIKTDLLVVTAGYGTTALADKLGVSIPQSDSPGFLVKTNPMPRILSTLSIIYAPANQGGKGGSVHFKQLTDGTGVLGEEYSESLELDNSEAHAYELVERAMAYLPKLEYVDSVRTSMVYRPMPIDGLPVIGFTKQISNVYFALTHSGVTLAPLLSEYASIEITTDSSVEMLTNYRPDRFNT